jgi:hypothetical protein
VRVQDRPHGLPVEPLGQIQAGNEVLDVHLLSFVD